MTPVVKTKFKPQMNTDKISPLDFFIGVFLHPCLSVFIRGYILSASQLPSRRRM
jgi:hypothetical protein